MREVMFHAELAGAFRAVGCWIQKWPDQVVSAMRARGDGKLRFALPKPCDLVGCAPHGRFLAIEAKLARAAAFHVDRHLLDQLEVLRDLADREAVVGLALNFRFRRQRPPAVVNRAFLAMGGLPQGTWELGHTFTIGLEPKSPGLSGWLELERIPGGWRLPSLLVARLRLGSGD